MPEIFSNCSRRCWVRDRQFLLAGFSVVLFALQGFAFLFQVGFGLENAGELVLRRIPRSVRRAGLFAQFRALRGVGLFELGNEVGRSLAGRQHGFFQLRFGFTTTALPRADDSGNSESSRQTPAPATAQTVAPQYSRPDSFQNRALFRSRSSASASRYSLWECPAARPAQRPPSVHRTPRHTSCRALQPATGRKSLCPDPAVRLACRKLPQHQHQVQLVQLHFGDNPQLHGCRTFRSPDRAGSTTRRAV